MIKVRINETQQEDGTKIMKAPENMRPEWKQVLSFDILQPQDEVKI